MDQQDNIHNTEEWTEVKQYTRAQATFVPGCYLFGRLIHLLQKLPTPIQNCTQTLFPLP